MKQCSVLFFFLDIIPVVWDRFCTNPPSDKLSGSSDGQRWKSVEWEL